MCGIVGYIGKKEAKPVLLDCLSRLEYRGYDSCGLAVRGSAIKICKDAVRVNVLEKTSPPLNGTVGIGHTRWATHGAPSAINAHPHFDCHNKIAVVHNGVITNYQKLRNQLTGEGHRFISETDTEVIPHLIEKYYHGDIAKAVVAALGELEGSYAFIVLTEYEPRLVVARKDSPLIIGIGDGENLIASDAPAILNYTNQVIYLEDGDIGVVAENGISISHYGQETQRKVHRISWSREDIQKGGYEHFMIKEIHEQPRVIRDTLAEYLASDSAPALSSLQSVSIVACGTSYHAGLIGKYVIEEMLGILTRVELASEFNHRRRCIPPSQAIIITQSGETADVLQAMRRLKEMGVPNLVITNVPGSTANRLGDSTIYIKAGPEVSVAATKSFVAQLIVLYLLACGNPVIGQATREQLVSELRQLPTLVQQILDNQEKIIECARYISQHENVFFIGRGINFPVALEGALKLKEISYIHAEGYAAGELKHGPLALLHQNVPVVAIVSQDNTRESMLTSIKEVKARNAPVLAVADDTDEVISGLVDFTIQVPHASHLFAPVLNAVPCQLLAYYTAKFRDCPIDFPRNLAKSVTVE